MIYKRNVNSPKLGPYIWQCFSKYEKANSILEEKGAKEIIRDQLYVLLQLEVGFTHSTTHK